MAAEKLRWMLLLLMSIPIIHGASFTHHGRTFQCHCAGDADCDAGAGSCDAGCALVSGNPLYSWSGDQCQSYPLELERAPPIITDGTLDDCTRMTTMQLGLPSSSIVETVSIYTTARQQSTAKQMFKVDLGTKYGRTDCVQQDYSIGNNFTYYLFSCANALSEHVNILLQDEDVELLVCEVVVSGYNHQQCYCDDVCDVMGRCTGTCQRGYQQASDSVCRILLVQCPVGYWGEDCMRPSKCNVPVPFDTGMCPGSDCKPGWMGTRCQDKCSEGWWGSGCKNICDCNEEPCNIINGRCKQLSIPSSTAIPEMTISTNDPGNAQGSKDNAVGHTTLSKGNTTAILLSVVVIVVVLTVVMVVLYKLNYLQ